MKKKRHQILNRFRFGLILLMSAGTLHMNVLGQNLGGVELVKVYPRVLTPNNDQLNDVVFFEFDSDISGYPIDTNIHDINGAKVSSMVINNNNSKFLVWDGKYESGEVANAGIYIYSIKIGKNIATGTVVVAK